jgi:cystathionine beta-lyase
MEVLTANRRTVAEWVASSSFDLGYRSPDATYLSWIDFGGTPVAGDPAGELLRRGRVQLSPGWETSQHTATDTDQFARLNFATSPENLAALLGRIEEGMTSAGRLRR